MHRQRGIDFTPLRLHLRAATVRLRDQTDVIPVLPGEGQRRCTKRHALRKGHITAHFVDSALLEQRQPLRAIHRRHVQLDA